MLSRSLNVHSRALANPAHLTKLKEGVETWYRWRKKASNTRPDLRATDFSEALFGFTILAAVDLSQAKGLETDKPGHPSTIGFDTLVQSRGHIPAFFLRSCGLPDWQREAAKLNPEALTHCEVDHIVYRIAELRSGQAIQFYSCFISYSTEDQSLAKQLHEDLQKRGFAAGLLPTIFRRKENPRANGKSDSISRPAAPNPF